MGFGHREYGCGIWFAFCGLALLLLLPKEVLGMVILVILVGGWVFVKIDATVNRKKYEQQRLEAEQRRVEYIRRCEEEQRKRAEDEERWRMQVKEERRLKKEKEERELKEVLGFKNWRNFLADVRTGEDYEAKIAKVFERMGFPSYLTKRSGDNGVDIVVHTGDGNYAVQCKFYRKRPIGNDAVQEVISGMLFVDNCAGGLVVTNSKFTNAAVALARKQGRVTLLHHEDIPEYVDSNFKIIVAGGA